MNSQTLETQQPGTFPHQVASVCSSEGDGTRTRNHRIDSPPLPRRKPSPHKAVTANADSGRTTGRTRPESERSEGGILDADLAALVAAWPTLPEHVRATIRTLIGTVAPTPTPFAGPPNLTRALEGRGNSRKPSPEKV